MELADVIARIESSNRQYAQRIEKHRIGVSGPELIAAIKKAHGGLISDATCDIYAAMSHGFFQFMGFRLWGNPARNILNLGYKGTLWDFLNSVVVQRAMFKAYCIAGGVDFTPDQLEDPTNRIKFAAVYNGPGNVPAYSEKLVRALAALRNA